ncbi:hypothetical protein F183_A38020 [Bryobacterales bacterium F-183]|nr:hypothetical protein F183_A38020 [Bryobacterales bacterium F-183]
MRYLLRTLLLAFFPALLTAQLSVNPVQDYINKTTLLNNILSNMRVTHGASVAGVAPKAAAPAPGPTEFRHSGSRILPKRFPRPAVSESFLELYEKTAKDDRFPANDLAYAMTYFVVNSYMTVHDLHRVDYEYDPWAKRGKDSFDRIALMGQKKNMTPTPLQERAVFLQFREELSKNPKIVKMTDAEKQEMTELLAITFGENFLKYRNALSPLGVERDAEVARKEAAANLQKLFGIPAERLKINESGFTY